MYASLSLESLVSRLSPDPRARAAPAGWARITAEVFYQVEAWGNVIPDDADGADDIRSRYMRVKPGGRLLLSPTRAEHADALAERYGVSVEIGTEKGAGAGRRWVAGLFRRHCL